MEVDPCKEGSFFGGINDDDWFNDPVSRIPIEKRQINLLIGADLIANEVDAGIFYGWSRAYDTRWISLDLYELLGWR